MKKSKNHEGDFNFPKMSKYLDSYVYLSKDRHIFLNEDVTKDTSSIVSALLLHYDNKDPSKDIFIYINSNGGDASALTNMYDVIQFISAPVSTVCMGKAYSAGAVLLAAGAKGKRYAYKHSSIMIHGIQCAFPILSENDGPGARNYYEFLSSHNDTIMQILADHTGHSLEKVKKDCTRDYFMGAEEAVRYGLIDQVL